MAVLVAALAVYAFDCFAASTPDEAMQCCDSMPCPDHSDGDSQGCCQTMPTLHAPFMQSHSLDAAFHAPGFFAIVYGADALPSLNPSAQNLLTANSHAPPALPAAASGPLRI